MSWQGSTYQLVVWIRPLGTVLGILIPLANRQEGTTEKMLVCFKRIMLLNMCSY